ncbi:hypothetical protein ACB092_12G057700 [Castanea dentata]
MTVITFPGGMSLKLFHAFLFITLLLHLRPAPGFISGVGVGDANNISCLEGERQALLKFKKGLIDDHGLLSSWRSEDEHKNCCNWEGVCCSNQTAHVLELELHSLRGIISPSLLELPYLTFLDLGGNDFNQSHIPKFIGSLNNLKYLDLSWANLSGPIPHQLGNLSHLQYLNLGGNNLQGVISDSFFSNFSKLRSLDLSHTSLSLKFSLDWIPPFQLDKIYLTSCNLGPTFPNWIQTQRKVSFLEISDANISDTIPAEWLEDLPSTLMDLNISSNQIHGQLPNVLAKGLHGLAIDLSANRLEGTLPLFPTNLTFLNLSKNRFSGSISSLCKINAQLLAFLDLSDNILSGRLPNCFMHWRKLIVLNLAGNNFFGEVPTSLGSLSGLKTLNLNNNNFFGELPSSLGNCSSLIVMDLGKNRFSGKVPAWIGEGLPRLFSLSLHSNNFAGSIPLHLCWLKDLRILDLSLNDISGTIPQCLNNFTGMTQRGTSSVGIIKHFIPYSYYNDITYGKEYVDSVMVTLKGSEFKYSGRIVGYLKIIDLSGNKLTGKLPSEILSLLGLVALNISRNNLIGEIPQMIGQLTQLELLDLSWNKISGEIPSSMSNLTVLSLLNLSYNNLSGKIPSGNQLQTFDPFAFAGNPGLCGPPLTQLCPGEEAPNQSKPTEDGIKDNEEDEDEFRTWFYIGIGFGSPIGFWGVCIALVFDRSWRHAYFLLLDRMKDWLYVTMIVNMARLQRKFQRQG